MTTAERYTAIAEQAAWWSDLCDLPADTALTWQVFSPVGAEEGAIEVLGREATFAATPAELATALRRHCDGADFPNVYLTTGLHDPPHRRRQATCRRVLAVAIDADAKDWLAATRPGEYANAKAAEKALRQLGAADLAARLDAHRDALLAALLALGIEPTALLRSGYGHYALLLLAPDDGADLAACREVNADLVAALNAAAGYHLADPSAKDCGTRVLRLPGAYNVKDPARPLPCAVLQDDGPTWPLAALRALVPRQARSRPQERQEPYTPPDGADRYSDRDVALLALDRTPPGAADEYATWLDVGMALQAVSDDLLPDWERWSATSPKHKAGECEAKWRTFTPGRPDGLGVGYLVNLARQTEPDFLRPGWRHKAAGPVPGAATFAQEPRQAPRRTMEAPTMLAEAPVPPEGPEAGPTAHLARHCEPGRFRRDDIGNAERFVALCGDRFRYCFDWNTWLVYDGTRWALDNTAEARAAARAVARSILREALAAPDDARGDLAKWAVASATRQRLDAMLYLAQPDLAVLSEALDADPDLLNCTNGTIDLRSGELHPHRPEDLITRRVEAPYLPGADLADTPAAADWRKFLADATNGDEELHAYIRRGAGYSLTGDPNEEVLFFAYGPERTGKSTFLETVRALLADYADNFDMEAILRKREGSDARPEIAKLQGKRFATAVEAGPTRSFAAELVKWLTGGDTISARALHANPVSWRPQFTIWLAANDRPNVRHDDGATWRRLRVVPFVHQRDNDPNAPNGADRGLKKRLRERSGAAVLAWLVRGCLEWRQVGLGSCAAVEEATGAYREAMDPIGDWLAECCDVRPEHDDWFTPTADLFDNFRRWQEAAGERPTLTAKQVGEHLTGRKLNKTRRRVGGRLAHGYTGIRLTEQPEFGFDGNDETAPKGPSTRNSVPGSTPLTEPTVPGVPGTAKVAEMCSFPRDDLDPPGTPGTPGTDHYPDSSLEPPDPDDEGAPW